MLKFIAIALFSQLIVGPVHAAIDYTTAFENLQNDVVWPAPSSNTGNISSTFGPRIRSSCNCDDFHRGVDIHGDIGDPVVATYDGKVVKKTTYSSGGKTIILEHEFDDWVTLVPGLGNTKRWYTLYLHLNDWAVEKGDMVTAGEIIGELGDTGSTVNPHLHQEVRVGTRCSLEWAENNPSSKCNTKGYDPHVSPFLVYPDMEETDITTTTSQTMNGSVDGIARFETPDVIANVNKYLVEVVDTTSGAVVQSHTLDFNLRIGYDATSTAALDTFDTTVPYLSPVSFGYSAAEWKADLIVPAGWLASKTTSEEVVVTVSDIWGVEQPSVLLADGSVSW